MTDRNMPTYDLDSIKKTFNHPSKLLMTTSAKQGQIAADFSDQDVVDTIQSLTRWDFYKSMPPAHENFIAWQDVYKTKFKQVLLYIKFQVNANRELILSFKEK